MFFSPFPFLLPSAFLFPVELIETQGFSGDAQHRRSMPVLPDSSVVFSHTLKNFEKKKYNS